MELSFKIKSLGKKRPFIEHQTIDVKVSPNTTLETFLVELVKQQVSAFNQRKEDKNLIPFLNQEVIDLQSGSGQIKFNEQYNQTPADEIRAIEVVKQAFLDGLIAVFVNDLRPEQLEDKLLLKPLDSITIVRLTFLAGSLW